MICQVDMGITLLKCLERKFAGHRKLGSVNILNKVEKGQEAKHANHLSVLVKLLEVKLGTSNNCSIQRLQLLQRKEYQALYWLKTSTE